MTAFYAIRNDNGRRHFFEWNKVDTFATREELEAAIGEWRKSVTSRIVERVHFEIHEEVC